MKMLILLLVCVMSLAATYGAPIGDNLIRNGDFEDDSVEFPPVGWVIYGDEQWVMPEHFVLDPIDPHQGKYSLRVHHPARSHAFPVSDSDRPIKPREGMAYAVSFWYRTANETEPAVFYWATTGHGSLMWSRSLAPSKQWRQMRFEFHEGVDFLADDIGGLLAAFRPTRIKDAEQTLWIDEVVVREVPGTRQRLVDPKTLDHPPLDHRLAPGERLEVRVDAAVKLRPVAREVAGVTFHSMAGFLRHPYSEETGQYVLEPKLERAIRDARLSMTRFYAVIDEPWPLEETLDKISAFMETCGIPKEWTVLELETQGAQRRLSPEIWARAARHNVEKSLGFRFWEISNEPHTRKATAFDDPDDYVEHLIACSKAIRAVQPDARIGIAVATNTQGWCNYLLKQTAGHYDFVVGHYYAHPAGASLPEVALTTNIQLFERILDVNALIDLYNPETEAYQLDTEWAIRGLAVEGEPDSAWRNSNIFATMHRAVRLIYYAREGMMRAAGAWQIFRRAHEGRKPDFTFLTRDFPDKAFMNYWLYYYFNRHVGEYVLDIEGTAPLVPPGRRDAGSALHADADHAQ